MYKTYYLLGVLLMDYLVQLPWFIHHLCLTLCLLYHCAWIVPRGSIFNTTTCKATL